MKIIMVLNCCKLVYFHFHDLRFSPGKQKNQIKFQLSIQFHNTCLCLAVNAHAKKAP